MSEPAPAGFLMRAVALVIDFMVFGFVQFTFGVLAVRLFGASLDEDLSYQSAIFFFTLLFTVLYTTAMHSIAGQTIGKMLTRVQVVNAAGEPPTAGTALLRYLGYYVSLFTFTLGFIMAGLRQDKRALHDLIAGTWVVTVPPVLPEPPARAAEEPPVPAIVDDRPSSGYL